MKIALVTDAWAPQVNGVVTTLVELHHGLQVRGHDVVLIEPAQFRRFRCPGYREMELAWMPGRRVARLLDAGGWDAIHIATEGPIGMAARRHCRRRGWAFSSAFHTRFPEILARAMHLPERWGYALFRRFHAASSAVMVPSAGMRALLEQHGYTRLKAWSHGVDMSLFQPVAGADLGLPRPVFLHVGRLSYEKNLEAFLALDLPGSKVVYGSGPLREGFEAQFPDVHWRGVVPRTELAAIYSAADVFVFPGRCETFGLVMLEALACGTPVAAYPVAGPLDVLGDSDAGVLHQDLKQAALKALLTPPGQARARARQFDWERCCDEFVSFLVPLNHSPAASPPETALRAPRAVREPHEA